MKRLSLQRVLTFIGAATIPFNGLVSATQEVKIIRDRTMKTTLCCFALCILSLSFAAQGVSAYSTPGSDADMSINIRQNDITITCPKQMSYRAEALAGWDAGYYELKILMFEDATVAGRILTCNYSANKGGVRDTSMLAREMPAGYFCKSERVHGAKNWSFTCKRAVAPIKIKPKS